MTDETIAAPVPDAPAAPVQAETTAVETDALLPEGEQPEQAAPGVEEEEFDLEDGKKVKVPKDLKPYLLRDKDYRHKTMTLAEERRAHEETVKARQAEYDTAQRYIEEIADIRAIDRELADYQKFTPAQWNQFWDSNPIEAGKAQNRMQFLQNARQQLVGQVQAKETQRTQQAQRDYAKRLEDARSTLQRDIPGWSEGLAGKVRQTATNDYGLKESELDTLIDPRYVRVLHDAHQYRQLIAKQRAAAQAAAPAPVPAIAQVGTARAPSRGLSDKMSPEEWAKERNRQIAESKKRRA